MNEQPKPDQTEKAFREVAKMKAEKRKGEITLLFDGSGNVAKVKKSEYI
jgi:hypothetical protein